MIRIPLLDVRIPDAPVRGAKAILPVFVRNHEGQWKQIDMLVDPGSAITTMPLSVAVHNRLIVPTAGVEMPVRTAAGRVRQRRRFGYLAVRILGLERRQFTWPCHFVEYASGNLKPALGLAGVLDDLRLVFDGTYRADAPYGSLIIELLSGRV